MTRRVAIGVLWFATVWVAYEIAWSLAGVPRLAGPVFAAAIASIVATNVFGMVGVNEARPTATGVTLGDARTAR